MRSYRCITDLRIIIRKCDTFATTILVRYIQLWFYLKPNVIWAIKIVDFSSRVQFSCENIIWKVFSFGHSLPILFNFVFYIVDSANNLPIARFEPRTFGVGKPPLYQLSRTTAQVIFIIISIWYFSNGLSLSDIIL